MVWSQLGATAALRQLGLEKTALQRVPQLDDDVGDADLPESVRRDLLMQHLERAKAHQLAPKSEYVREARETARPAGALVGGLMGGGMGLSTARNGREALLRAAAGAAIGGLGGYGLGHWLGGASGAGDYTGEKADLEHFLGVESKPHGIDRELAAQVRAAKERAIEDQRAHDREIAHMNQRRINYNVDAGRGSPLNSYGRLGGGYDTWGHGYY